MTVAEVINKPIWQLAIVSYAYEKANRDVLCPACDHLAGCRV